MSDKKVDETESSRKKADNESNIKINVNGGAEKAQVIKEGKATVCTEDGVFYNPRMKFCRDMDMLVFSELNSREYLDALSATGIRGIRSILEPRFNTVFNDRSLNAFNLILRNLELNGISGDEVEVLNKDANILLRGSLFDHVDIDPFGSPSHFIDSACFSAKRFLSVTATDTAALCGSAKVSGLRKYSAFAEKLDCYPEVGIRMLLGKVAREATKYDKGIEVLLSWTKEHYYRSHLRIKRSVSYAGRSYRKIGYLFYCGCGERRWANMLEAEIKNCKCGKSFRIMGPLWLGELHDSSLADNLIQKIENNRRQHEMIKQEELLKRIKGELEIPFHYDVHVVSRLAKASPPAMAELKDLLTGSGFSFSRTRFSGTSFKTDAKIEEILRVLGR